MSEKQTKTDFVRSLPRDYSVEQVMAALEKAGYPKTTRATAFSLRTTARREKPKKTNGHTKPAQATEGTKLSASDFIRAQPLTMDAPEVAAAAKAAGYATVTPKYVGSIRWRYRPRPHALAPANEPVMKEEPANEAPVVAVPPPLPTIAPPQPLPQPVPVSEPLPAAVKRAPDEWRRLFVECVCELGLTRAARLLGEVEELITSATLEGIEE